MFFTRKSMSKASEEIFREQRQLKKEKFPGKSGASDWSDRIFNYSARCCDCADGKFG